MNNDLNQLLALLDSAKAKYEVLEINNQTKVKIFTFNSDSYADLISEWCFVDEKLFKISHYQI